MGQKHACLNISELSREHIGPLSSFWKPNQKAPPWPLTSNSCIRVFAAKVDRSHQVPERHTRHRDDCNFCVTHWEMTVTNKAPLHPQLILSCMAIMIFFWHDGINAAANLSAAWWVGLVHVRVRVWRPNILCFCYLPPQAWRSKVKWFYLLCQFAALIAHSCAMRLASRRYSPHLSEAWEQDAAMETKTRHLQADLALQLAETRLKKRK